MSHADRLGGSGTPAHSEHVFVPCPFASALGALAAAAAGYMLWPVAPRNRRNVPRGRIELTYWEKWPGIEGLALQNVIDRFNAMLQALAGGSAFFVTFFGGATRWAGARRLGAGALSRARKRKRPTFSSLPS